MVLSIIQSQLTDIYDIYVSHDVTDYLCSREHVLAANGAPERGEVLLVAEDEEEAYVGLYVDPSALAALESAGDPWLDGRLRAASLALEGVSHFVYLLHRGTEAGVSQLELELQAEVDKYAVGVAVTRPNEAALSGRDALRGLGAGFVQQRSRAIRRQVYEGVAFIDPQGSEEGDRYRCAHRHAARLAHKLEKRYLRNHDTQGWFRALRSFYRASLSDKLHLARRG